MIHTPKQGPCVIFDMDGVIFDSERACLECWREMAASRDIPGIEAVFMRCIGTNEAQTRDIVEAEYAPRFGKGCAGVFLDEMIRIFRRRYETGALPVKPGAEEILRFLKARGARIGLASSTNTATASAELKAAGLLDYFDTVTGGDRVSVSKPDPEIYLIACASLGAVPSETFAVEDSYNGIRAARAAGMRPVMVPDLIPADGEMTALAEAVCGDLFEVMDLLGRMMQKGDRP